MWRSEWGFLHTGDSVIVIISMPLWQYNRTKGGSGMDVGHVDITLAWSHATYYCFHCNGTFSLPHVEITDHFSTFQCCSNQRDYPQSILHNLPAATVISLQPQLPFTPSPSIRIKHSWHFQLWFQLHSHWNTPELECLAWCQQIECLHHQSFRVLWQHQ